MSEWQLNRWMQFWEQEPWGEIRADQRAAAQALWNTAPYAGEGASLPSLTYPYFRDEEAEIEKTIQAIEEQQRKVLDGRQHRKTSDPPNN